MKKTLPIGLLTLCLALSAQPAFAWINSRAGIGINWSWQSGGNNLLWGMLRDGQPPAPCPIPGCQPPFMPGCPMPGPGPCGPGYTFPGPHQSYGNNEFPFFGRNGTPTSPAATNLPQTAQTGHGTVHHPVGYSPAAAQQSYRYPTYAPQYPAPYTYPYYRR